MYVWHRASDSSSADHTGALPMPPRLHAICNVGERSRQSNAGGPKRWLMRSAIRLDKRGCSSRQILSRMKVIVAKRRRLTQGTGMRDANPTVLIVDDDPEFRDSVGRLLRTVGLHTQQFSSVSDFFQADRRTARPAWCWT